MQQAAVQSFVETAPADSESALTSLFCVSLVPFMTLKLCCSRVLGPTRRAPCFPVPDKGSTLAPAEHVVIVLWDNLLYTRCTTLVRMVQAAVSVIVCLLDCRFVCVFRCWT